MIFKRKNLKKEKTCKVLFKQKHTVLNRKVRKKHIFSKIHSIRLSKRKNNPRGEKIKKIRRNKILIKIFSLMIIIGICLFGAYTMMNFVIGIRGGTSSDELLYEKTYVEGIESVPTYPHSEFAYKNKKNEEIVLRMLSQGISVYKLPRNTKTTHVYEYYQEKLPPKGWVHIFTIPISTQEQLLGQYWIKGEKGLRIHVANNDIWYELLTKLEAESALSERRIAEIQRKRILETSTEQTLLPDYPWKLLIPREYLTRYSSTDLGELQSVEIYEIGGQTKFLIYPIGESNSQTYDKMLEEFFQKQTEKLEEKWSIINTRIDFQKGREVLTARILIGEKEGEGIVLVNKRNFTVYAIIANEIEHPFFQEIITNIYEP